VTARRAGALLSVLLALLAGPARAAAPPDSAQLAKLHGGHWNRYRILTARARFELVSIRTDSIGVLLEPEARRPAVLLSADAAVPHPRHARWAEIESIDAARTHAGRGLAEGVLIGGIVGLSVAVLVGTSVHDESAIAAIGALPLGIVFGGFAGASFGHSTRWQRLYP